MASKCSLTKLDFKTARAYQRCQMLANSHYENFPIASFFLPSHIRRAIATIYAFARTADDIADEGKLNREQRLELMTKFESHLYDIQYGKPPSDDIFIALRHTIDSFNLPVQLFYDLLTAFRQDILKSQYQTFEEVHDYCHYSANPIGRLLLHLTGQDTRENILLSDHLCTGLQLLNFIQDITIDARDKNRCYIPSTELKSFNVSFSDILQQNFNTEYKNLITLQLKRAERIYCQGVSLGDNLPGLFGLEIKFIINCGLKLIDKLHHRPQLDIRPIIKKRDLFLALTKAICTNKLWKNIEKHTRFFSEQSIS